MCNLQNSITFETLDAVVQALYIRIGANANVLILPPIPLEYPGSAATLILAVCRNSATGLEEEWP